MRCPTTNKRAKDRSEGHESVVHPLGGPRKLCVDSLRIGFISAATAEYKFHWQRNHCANCYCTEIDCCNTLKGGFNRIEHADLLRRKT